MKGHIEIGRKGESIAANFLKEKGYDIRECNFRYQKSEIDIIAQLDELLVFVEVKTRTSSYFGNPEDAVDPSKEEMIFNASEHYILENDWEGEVRYDIISVVHEKEIPEILHFKDVF